MSDGPTVLVTGGAGYIGSHTCKALATAGLRPVVYDNLVHGHRHAVKWGPLIVGDVRDESLLRQAMREHKPSAVIHFAAFAYVGESMQHPARYYDNNVRGTLSLLEAMRKEAVTAIVFSSTCAIYGVPHSLPIVEELPPRPLSPYGSSKLMVEQVLQDYAQAYSMGYACLRYFNACGADQDGEIGEEHDPEPHLIPRAIMAALGDIPHFDVFGADYPTRDGTCIRDYVHVADLAQGHLLALRHLQSGKPSLKVNLGTGRGASVRDVLTAVEAVSGRKFAIRISPRRAGDPAELYADIGKARAILGFEPRYTELQDIIVTALAFERSRRVRVAKGRIANARAP